MQICVSQDANRSKQCFVDILIVFHFFNEFELKSHFDDSTWKPGFVRERNKLQRKFRLRPSPQDYCGCKNLFHAHQFAIPTRK